MCVRVIAHACATPVQNGALYGRVSSVHVFVCVVCLSLRCGELAVTSCVCVVRVREPVICLAPPHTHTHSYRACKHNSSHNCIRIGRARACVRRARRCNDRAHRVICSSAGVCSACVRECVCVIWLSIEYARWCAQRSLSWCGCAVALRWWCGG